MAPIASTSSIQVHPPQSGHRSLSNEPGGFDRAWFMGRWAVMWSTLPMWKPGRQIQKRADSGFKDKKNVYISYERIDGSLKAPTKILSRVEYVKQTAKEGARLSIVKGIETLTEGTNGATFDWRGAGMLTFVRSHWEILGYGSDKETGLEWAVTLFSKTMFTPAGIDIYLRSIPRSADSDVVINDAVRSALRDRIAEVIKSNTDPEVKKLAAEGFEVPSGFDSV